MIAVTDLDGFIRKCSVTWMPMRRLASNAPQMAGCNDNGKSPYPGLKRSVRNRLGKRWDTSLSTWSHPASTQALPQAFSITVLRDGLLPLVKEWLDYGALHGTGQWRNSGKGRFVYTAYDDNGEKLFGTE